MDFGAGELFIIALAILLLFGSKKIPDIARGLGKGVRELKDATQSIQREINSSMDDPFADAPKRATEPSVKEEKPVEEKPVPVIASPPGAMPRSNTGYSAGSAPDSSHGVEPGSKPGGNDSGNQTNSDGDKKSG